jgi:hypothetical protein
MKKNFSHISLSLLAIIAIFAFGALVPSSPASAQTTPVTMTTLEVVTWLYSQGFITQEQAIRAVSAPLFPTVQAVPITFLVGTSTISVQRPIVPAPVAPTVPAAPSNLNSSAVITSCTTEDVTLSWGIVPGATGYAVKFDNLNATTTGVYTTYYTVHNVTPGKTYTWSVRALKDNQSSVQASGQVILPASPASCTAAVSTSTPSTAPVVTLGGISSQLSCNTNTLDLTWNAVPGASAYNLRINDRADGWLSTSQTCANMSNSNNKDKDECVDGIASTTLKYSAYKVATGHTYDFWLDVPNLGASNITRFTIPQCPVAPVPTLTLVAASTTISSGASTTLTWATGNSPTTCTASNGWTGSKNIAGGTESTGNLTSAKTYTLACSNASGTTTKSATVSIATVTPPVTKATVTIGQTANNIVLPKTVTSVDLSWAAKTGETNYNLRVDDQTANVWSGQCNAMNPKDLCWNGYRGVGTINYSVQPGHSYKFWVDGMEAYSTQDISFSVAQ